MTHDHSAMQSAQQQSPTSPAGRRPVPDSWVEKLFSRLTATFGTSQLLSAYQGADLAEVKSVWAHELARLHPGEIAAGVDRLSTLRFCPNIGEFIRLCRPPVDYEGLFEAASRGCYTLQAQFIAAQHYGSFALRTARWDDARHRWTQLLDDALEEHGNRAYVPPDVPALPPPAPITRDEVVDARARMREMIAAAGPSTPGHAWAEKILIAAADGQPMLSIQIEMAARALGIDHRTIEYRGAKR